MWPDAPILGSIKIESGACDFERNDASAFTAHSRLLPGSSEFMASDACLRRASARSSAAFWMRRRSASPPRSVGSPAFIGRDPVPKPRGVREGFETALSFFLFAFFTASSSRSPSSAPARR